MVLTYIIAAPREPRQEDQELKVV
jgi:hypothetical protein